MKTLSKVFLAGLITLTLIGCGGSSGSSSGSGNGSSASFTASGTPARNNPLLD